MHDRFRVTQRIPNEIKLNNSRFAFNEADWKSRLKWNNLEMKDDINIE